MIDQEHSRAEQLAKREPTPENVKRFCELEQRAGRGIEVRSSIEHAVKLIVARYCAGLPNGEPVKVRSIGLSSSPFRSLRVAVFMVQIDDRGRFMLRVQVWQGNNWIWASSREVSPLVDVLRAPTVLISAAILRAEEEARDWIAACDVADRTILNGSGLLGA